jgi:hypothetical protein
MLRVSYPRRQQCRRIRRAVASGAAGLAAGALAVIAAAVGAIAVAGMLVLVMIGLLTDARRWVRLAGRSRLGARSEDEVRRTLAALETEGWRMRHSLPYRDRGDIDSVAIAPTGIAFAMKPRPDRLTRDISPACQRWPRGCTAGGGAGVLAELAPSCASCAPEAGSASRTRS